jgi:hypothetical protein
LLPAHAIAADRLRQRAVGREDFREGGQEETPEKVGRILADGLSINDPRAALEHGSIRMQT